MANPIDLFNYYRRYRWTAQNFTDLQAALIDESDGLAEGAYGAAVLNGLEVTGATAGMTAEITQGIASGPTGYLMVVPVDTSIGVTAPTGTNPAKSLIVLRPEIIQSNNITKPTSPFESVPLNFTRGVTVFFIGGTASATPEYPSKGINDVILAGIKLSPGQTSLSAKDFDYSVRETIGVNSQEIGQESLFYDDRLKPYRNSYKSLGIKPSQTIGSRPKLFSYPSRNTPSIFPKTSGGDFNPLDTFLDFATGAITGGDQVSVDFTPTMPTGSNSIVATVFLLSNDQLSVSYGVQGTFQECLDGIQNQDTGGGAGSIFATQDNYKLCYVIVSSISGVVSDILVIDSRLVGSNSAASGANPKVDAIFPIIIGSPTQVTGGAATHSTFASAQTDASSDDDIFVLDGSFTENVVQIKPLRVKMANGALWNGTWQFSSGSKRSSLDGRLTDNVTIDNGVTELEIFVSLANGKSVTDNNPQTEQSNFVEWLEED